MPDFAKDALRLTVSQCVMCTFKKSLTHIRVDTMIRTVLYGYPYEKWYPLHVFTPHNVVWKKHLTQQINIARRLCPMGCRMVYVRHG